MPLTIWGILDYLNDWLVVTTRRVVHQEKVLFVNEWRKEAPLEQIQSVRFQTTWLGRWLNYGTTTVRTAATLGVITFEYTTGFAKLSETIMEQRAQRQKHTVAQSKTVINQTLEQRLGLENYAAQPGLRTVSRGKKQHSTRRPQGHRERQCSATEGTQGEGEGNPVGEGKDAGKEEDAGEGAGEGEEESVGGEKIIWRKHWIILVPKLAGVVVLLFLVALGVVALMWGTSLQEESQWVWLFNGMTAVLALVGVATILWGMWIVADWHNDTYELDNEAITHIDKMPLGLSENRMSTTLNRIQNVTMSIPTPIHWIFNFGNVKVQTAAEVGPIRLPCGA